MKNFFIVLFNFILIVNSIAQNADELTKKGMKKLEVKEFDQALTNFSSAIEINKAAAEKLLKELEVYQLRMLDTSLTEEEIKPLNGSRNLALPYFGRAKAYAGKKNLEEAMNDINMAIRLDEEFADAYYIRALFKNELEGELAACMDYALAANLGSEKAKKIYDAKFCWETSIKYYRQARVKFDLKKYDVVLEKLDTAIRIDPKADEAYVTRAEVYFDQGHIKKAIREYNIAIKLDTMNASYIFRRGVAFAALKEYQKAFDDYSKALNLNSNYLDVYLKRAEACLSMQQYNSADFDYSSAIRLAPNNGEIYFLRAKVREALPKYDEEASCEDYKKAYSLDYLEAQEKYDYCNLHPVVRKKMKEKAAKEKK